MSETAIDRVPPLGDEGSPRSTRRAVLKEAGGVLSVLGTCGAVDLALDLHGIDLVGGLAELGAGPSTVLFLLLLAVGIGHIGWRSRRPRRIAPLTLSAYWLGALLGWRALVQVSGDQSAPLVPAAFGGVMLLGTYVARSLLKHLADGVEPAAAIPEAPAAVQERSSPTTTEPTGATGPTGATEPVTIETLVETAPATSGRGRVAAVGGAILCIVLLLALVVAAERPPSEDVTVGGAAATASSPAPPGDDATPSTTSTTAPAITVPPQDPNTCVEPRWGSGLEDAIVRETLLTRAVAENLGCPGARADLVGNLAIQWNADRTRAITYEYVSHTMAVVDDVFVREWVERWGSLDMRKVDAESMERTTCRGVELWLLRDPKRVVIGAFLRLPTPLGPHSYAYLPPRIWLWWWFQLVANGVGPVPDVADATQSPPDAPMITMSFDGEVREFEEARPSTDQFPATDEVLSVCSRPPA